MTEAEGTPKRRGLICVARKHPQPFHRCYYIEISNQLFLRQEIPFYTWRSKGFWRVHDLLILTEGGGPRISIQVYLDPKQIFPYHTSPQFQFSMVFSWSLPTIYDLLTPILEEKELLPLSQVQVKGWSFLRNHL